MPNALRSPVLADALGDSKLGKSILLVVTGSLFLAASAKIQVPFYPVPMTMQTFVVLFLGFALGSRLGALTVVVYLVEGAAGLPVFAGTPEKGIGIPYMLGPTGGYLVGFVLAAWAVGALAERGWGRSLPRAAMAAMVGLVAVYLPGLAWLAAVVGWSERVLALGLMPFLPGEVLKIALLAIALPLIWRHVGGDHGTE